MRSKRGIVPLIGLLATAGVLVPVLIIVGIALAVLIFGLPAFIGALISPLRTLGIILVLVAIGWLFFARDFPTAGIIGAVGLLLLLGTSAGLLVIVSGTQRAQTELIGDNYYVFPAGSGPGMPFAFSKGFGWDEAGITLADNGCSPPDGGGWEKVGKAHIGTAEVEWRCEGSLLILSQPTPKVEQRVAADVEVTYKRQATQARLEDAQVAAESALSFWQQFIAWLRGVFA